MEIIILGTNQQDVGKQLEQLTGAILKKMGYKEISFNDRGKGGNEIDVTGLFKQPTIGQHISRELVCECKAYSDPVSMSAWLKFLGKIFTKELGKKTVNGCFIALSGVNGNVRGHYRDLQTHRDDITIVTGDDLIPHLTEQFGLEPVDVAIATVTSISSRVITNSAISWHNHKPYWLLSFADDNYTLLDPKGLMLEVQEIESLKPAISYSTKFLEFIDLSLEEQAVEQKLIFTKAILGYLLEENGFLTLQEIVLKFNSKPTINGRQIDLRDAREIIEELLEKDIVTYTNDSYILKVASADTMLSDTLNLIGQLHHKFMTPMGIASGLYKSLINNDLLEHILNLQGAINLDQQQSEECIQLIQWSPSVLNWALRPDPMLVNSKIIQQDIPTTQDTFQKSYFLQKISECFFKDYSNAFLHEHFFKDCGITEIEIQQKTIIKGWDKIVSQIEFKDRTSVNPLAEEHGGGYIMIRLLNEAAEPWERSSDLQKETQE